MPALLWKMQMMIGPCSFSIPSFVAMRSSSDLYLNLLDLGTLLSCCLRNMFKGTWIWMNMLEAFIECLPFKYHFETVVLWSFCYSLSASSQQGVASGRLRGEALLDEPMWMVSSCAAGSLPMRGVCGQTLPQELVLPAFFSKRQLQLSLCPFGPCGICP